MSIAIFILPVGLFEQEIISWKEKVSKNLANQVYTNHPPHLTIINLEVTNENKALDSILSLTSVVDPISISIKGTNIFWNDPKTKGHTLYFNIRENKPLRKFQKLIATKLRPYVRKGVAPKKFVKDDLFLLSQKKFGYPFVGKHWIPHFTISSLNVEKNHFLIDEFLSIDSFENFMVYEFSVWHIKNDIHKKLKTIPFK